MILPEGVGIDGDGGLPVTVGWLTVNRKERI